MSVVTRFAPSPTGLFHAGSYRTALFAYIFARQHEGKFILRIEDTDKERSKKEYEDNIIESLKWLGLDYDAFYRQSDRTEIYKKYIKRLIDSGHAYISKETPIEAGGRTEVIRFKNPNKRLAFNDLIRGRIEFDTTELGDFVIAKSHDEPVFHLVNVVDDYEMGMTHIIRGEDHISNTPRQILIYEAIGAPVPLFAHIPLLLAPDRSKLSKRHGAVPMTDYRQQGYVPEALVNYMALLGWHPAGDREVMALSEIVKEFTLERVQKGGAIFDMEKLRWFNRQYILAMNDTDFISHSETFVPEWLSSGSAQMKRLLPLLREKITTFGEIESLFNQSSGELRFVKAVMDYEPSMLLWKKNPTREVARRHLEKVKELLGSTASSPANSVKISTAGSADTNSPGADQESLNAESVKTAILPYAEANGKGDVLWPLRVALTGQEKSPDPFTSVSILGLAESLRRIEMALKKLE